MTVSVTANTKHAYVCLPGRPIRTRSDRNGRGPEASWSELFEFRRLNRHEVLEAVNLARQARHLVQLAE